MSENLQPKGLLNRKGPCCGVLKSLVTALLLWATSWATAAELSSYAVSANDITGVTGAELSALGAPDYAFVNDVALGFGGTNAEVFEPGESVVLGFSYPLRNLPGSDDLLLYIYVGGAGEADDASIQVEVSSDGNSFVTVHTFQTADARSRLQDVDENDYAGVKVFGVDFGAETAVTSIRLANLGGSAEGIRLDAAEGLHPEVGSQHAFELRIEEYQDPAAEKFKLRIKNLSDEFAQPITSVHVGNQLSPGEMVQSDHPLVGDGGEQFICSTGCADGSGTSPVTSETFVWSLDGASPAGSGAGLNPGRSAAHRRWESIDLDSAVPGSYLVGNDFWVQFADGYIVQFNFDDILAFAQQGAIYQQDPYFDLPPINTAPQTTHHFEFIDGPSVSTVTFSNPASVGASHEAGVGGRLVPTNQNFIEDGLHVEAFWVRNNQSIFSENGNGHFHDLHQGYETSHGFESEAGLGPDRQGIYVERVDGGTFDFISLEYQLTENLLATRIFINPVYDPAFPMEDQFTGFDVLVEPDLQLLEPSQFNGIRSIFISADLLERRDRIIWDNLRFAVPEPLTIRPFLAPIGDSSTVDEDGDGIESVLLDASAAYDPDGTIVAATWREGGGVLGSGLSLQLDLAVGSHQIELTILDDDGNTSEQVFTVIVGTPGGVPFAVAGDDIQVLDLDGDGFETVSLDGTGSVDPDGAVVAWTWSEGGVTLGSGATLDVALAVGSHTVDLLVEDDGGNTAADSVIVTVDAVGAQPPLADAGADVTVTDSDGDGIETVSLDGTGSVDPDGAVVAWTWSEGGVTLGSGATLDVALAVGSHTVDLLVEDDGGNTALDSVTVTVNAGGGASPAVYLGHQVTQESSNVAIHTLGVNSLPIAAGDLMVAQLCSDGGGATTIACPVGWTQVLMEASVSDMVTGAVCYKQAEAADEGVADYSWTTSRPQHSQSGVVLLTGHNAAAPIEGSAVDRYPWDTSPDSPALATPPASSSTVLRMMCANAGRVTEDVGYPAGMQVELWLQDSADGGSGPVSAGAAIDVPGAAGSAQWTDALSQVERSIGITVAIAGGAGAPLASAGSDVVVEDANQDGLEIVTLDGTGSVDPNGAVVSWTWSEGGVTLGTGSMLDLAFALGTHTVDLLVEDDEGHTGTDSVTITVEPLSVQLPVADAGADVTVTDSDGDGFETVSLDGTGSVDPDGAVVSWSWSEGGVTLGSGATLDTVFAVGTHTVDLLVLDNGGHSAAHSVTVTVNAVGAQPPLADAGADVTVTDSDGDGIETVSLDGTGSVDPDGAVVAWTWSEGGVTLGSGATLDVALAVGSHTVDLLVEDDGGNTALDSVTVTVNAGGGASPAVYLGHQVTQESSNVAIHTLGVNSLPIAAGDLMVAQLCSDGGGATTIACPVGWTQVLMEASVSDMVTGAVCYKQAEAADEGVADYSWTTSRPQHSQSGVVLLTGHNAAAPIEGSAVDRYPWDTSPDSPALATPPASSSTVLRMMCANAGRVTEDVGYPAGMQVELWLQDSADGGSGPVSAGAAIDVPGAAGSAQWTDALSQVERSIGITVAIAGGAGAPLASAGSDVVVEDANQDGLEIVTLDGTGSVDPNGAVVSWTWSEGGVTLGTGSMLDLAFALGTHTVDLLVEDDEGHTGTDSVTITVEPLSVQLPVADAGADVTVTDSDGDGFETVSLDGTGSVDPDGAVVSWSWSEGGVTLGSGATLDTVFAVGTHTVDLLVLDNGGHSAAHSVTVTVNAVGAQPPLADAGADVTVTDSDGDGIETVSLDGTGSVDPDGAVVAWTWSEGGVTLGSGATLDVALAVGSHTVDLLVEDDGGNTALDSVTVTVNAGGGASPAVYLGHQVTQESSNVAIHTLGVNSLPIAAGDLMVAQLCSDGGGATTIACPVGWTQVLMEASVSDMVTGAVCYKQAEAADEGVADYSWTTSRPQHSQSGVILLTGHNAAAPIEGSAVDRYPWDTSPDSPALATPPASSSTVLRMMCANAGRVTEDVGYPAGMQVELWLQDSADGGSGPVSAGAAIDVPGAAGSAQWTDALSQVERSIGITVSVSAQP